MKLKKTNQFVIFSIILISGICLFYSSLTNGHDWGDDFSSYIMQARSIVEGNPLRFIEENRFTIEQSSSLLGPIAYPWGYPILLAPFYSYFGMDLIAFKIVGLLSYAFFLITLYIGFRKIHGFACLMLLISFFAFNPVIIKFGDNILSDLPFLFLSTLSVVIVGFTIVDRRTIFSPISDRAILGLIIGLSFLIRTNGFLLLIALGMTQFISYLQYRESVYSQYRGEIQHPILLSSKFRSFWLNLIPYGAFFFLVLIAQFVLPDGGSSHLKYIGNATAASMLSNLVEYMMLPKELFGGWAVYILTVPFSLIGIKNRWQSDYHSLIYVTLTMILYSVWPYTQGVRYLFPVFPFYISFVITGIDITSRSKILINKKIDRKYYVVPVAIFIFYLFISSIYLSLKNLSSDRLMPDGPFTNVSQEMVSFIKNNTIKTDIIVFRKPRVMRLMTGRPSIMADRDEDLIRGNYIVIDKINKSNQLLIDNFSKINAINSYSLVFYNSQYLIYRGTCKTH